MASHHYCKKSAWFTPSPKASAALKEGVIATRTAAARQEAASAAVAEAANIFKAAVDRIDQEQKAAMNDKTAMKAMKLVKPKAMKKGKKAAQKSKQ